MALPRAITFFVARFTWVFVVLAQPQVFLPLPAVTSAVSPECGEAFAATCSYCVIPESSVPCGKTRAGSPLEGSGVHCFHACLGDLSSGVLGVTGTARTTFTTGHSLGDRHCFCPLRMGNADPDSSRSRS
jgi:hypothetical protein